MAGVERRMLDRQGAEVARATSIVRYAPGSSFECHRHGGGEEILVLEGTFSDDQGEYAVGTYLRNPAGSAHAPFSEEGCTLLVKLQQMHPADQQRVVIDTRTAEWFPGLVPGLKVQPLHAWGSEHVALVRWAPGTVFQPHGHPGGEEILVLDGVFQDEQGQGADSHHQGADRFTALRGAPQHIQQHPDRQDDLPLSRPSCWWISRSASMQPPPWSSCSASADCPCRRNCWLLRLPKAWAPFWRRARRVEE